MALSFDVLASHKILGFPDGNILSWCSQMNLLAVSMNLTSIWVFRLDGERVYSVNNRSRILHLQWGHSGKFFVLSGTDNLIKAYDANNGKLINQFATTAELTISLVSCNAVNTRFVLTPDGKPPPFQDLLRVDILNEMPKLANELDPSDAAGSQDLPPSSAAFIAEEDSALDYLLVISDNERVSVTFNNLFTVTGITLPTGLKFLKHSVSEDFFHQTFLVSDENSLLHLQDIHINIDGPRHRGFFFDTIRWVCQVISITTHINDQVCAMKNETKEFISLYDRCLSNYKDALYADIGAMTNFPSKAEVQEKIAVDLGEMLLTGLIPAANKDFWLNQFGERALTRLSTVGNHAYDNARKTLFTQIVLGSEKLIILFSYLESISKTAEVLKEKNFGIDATSVMQMITHTQQLVKKVYELIWKLNEEHERFNQFLNWVKIEVVEKLSREDSDPEAFFTEHTTLEFDASSLMEYFSEIMFDSVLAREFDLDYSSLETIEQRDAPISTLKGHIFELQNNLKPFLAEIENFVAQSFFCEPKKSLNTSYSGSQSDLAQFRSSQIVTSVNENTLSILETKTEPSKVNFDFPGTIISHILLNESSLLILYDTNRNKRRLDLIQFSVDGRTVHSKDLVVLKSSEFDLTPGNRPTYMALNSDETKRDAMVLLLDESKKDYVILQLYS